MSILADRKRKQKWVILDRNVNKSNNWSKDSNKFGQKLLERMGWKEGKGLGRNEDGLTDYVKVAYKNNSKGVGFKESVEWSAQQDNFNTLLGELSNSTGDVKKDKQQEMKSLEEKSQNSRARVHYRKFTRGKDLSRYSEKDLANIFGKKTLVETPKEDAVDVQDKATTNKGVFTTSGGSMVDYFKSKVTLNFNKSETTENFNDSESEQVSYGFGFNSQTTSSFATESSSCEISFTKKNKKAKNKNKFSREQKDTFVSYAAEENDDNIISKKRKGEILETSDEIQHTPSKKKLKFEASPVAISKTNKKSKKQKIKNAELPNLGLTNPGFEPLSTNITIKKHVLDTIIEDYVETNINELQTITNENNLKIKKKKSNDTEENIDEQNAAEDPKPKKNKKKLNTDSNSFAIDNPTFNTNDDVEVNEISQEQKLKCKKKKKSKGLANPALNNSSFKSQTFLQNGNLDSANCTQDFEVKLKKKKKPKGLDNPTLNLDDSTPDPAESHSQKMENVSKNVKENSEQESGQNYEVKRKKKKSKGLDNLALNVNESSTSFTESRENPSKNKSLQNGIENVALEISDCDIMLNVTDEPVKTTPKIEKGTSRNKFKNARFSKAGEEYIISTRSPGDIDKRNELYDINTKVIQDGLREIKKQKNSSLTNHSFDIKSVDKIDFCDDGFMKSPRKYTRMGIDNRGFDTKAQNVEESVNSLTRTIDNYQAELENGMNESKMKWTMREHHMVGEFNCSDGENEEHEKGVKLRFKYAQLQSKLPVWAKRNDLSATRAKKSYKHLIRGDIILGFKKTNLHKIDGYATSKPK